MNKNPRDMNFMGTNHLKNAKRGSPNLPGIEKAHPFLESDIKTNNGFRGKGPVFQVHTIPEFHPVVESKTNYYSLDRSISTNKHVLHHYAEDLKQHVQQELSDLRKLSEAIQKFRRTADKGFRPFTSKVARHADNTMTISLTIEPDSLDRPLSKAKVTSEIFKRPVPVEKQKDSSNSKSPVLTFKERVFKRPVPVEKQKDSSNSKSPVLTFKERGELSSFKSPRLSKSKDASKNQSKSKSNGRTQDRNIVDNVDLDERKICSRNFTKLTGEDNVPLDEVQDGNPVSKSDTKAKKDGEEATSFIIHGEHGTFQLRITDACQTMAKDEEKILQPRESKASGDVVQGPGPSGAASTAEGKVFKDGKTKTSRRKKKLTLKNKYQLRPSRLGVPKVACPRTTTDAPSPTVVSSPTLKKSAPLNRSLTKSAQTTHRTPQKSTWVVKPERKRKGRNTKTNLVDSKDMNDEGKTFEEKSTVYRLNHILSSSP
ncbi:uncharacterized protein LOC103509313 [Diaphorina citri]|uniref:Uncharacterized protein LOC103509313 n=1 Tax=Diaphorina citri TaxID=121845 RepID=A0A1S3D2M8_DIACI|nr:uncharacterized protein LOC103509313 [Diaphorina citri]